MQKKHNFSIVEEQTLGLPTAHHYIQKIHSDLLNNL